MTLVPVIPDPASSSVAVLHDTCRAIEAWMDTVEDITVLKDILDRTLAIETYLEAKNAQGPAQTTARLVEARIGDLLGPADNRGPATLNRDPRLAASDRYQFRLLAERREVWEDKLPLPRRAALRLIRDDEADARPKPERPDELLCDIRLGDFTEVLADIPDESLDLILTDPPYPAAFLPQWTKLAIFAKQKLAPDGLLAAMSGQTHLPDVLQRLGAEGLRYRWTMAYLMGGNATVVHARSVSTMWKPVFIYGSSKRRLYDVASSAAADKDFHGWGQSESGMADLLRLLADPGATVCDPFLGGGTTAVVAQALGCHFIGAEIDEKHYQTARRRLGL